MPLFKTDNELLCENYRPISLLTIFSKIFEKVVYIRMYSSLTENNLIYYRQIGFRSKHSTNHALINHTEDIKSYMDRGYIADGVYIDLQKAFDTVHHQMFCEKSLHLIKSFLSSRKQIVSINGFGSSKLNITCGVPQGSTLRPLLFLIYLNDLRFCVKTSLVQIILLMIHVSFMPVKGSKLLEPTRL